MEQILKSELKVKSAISIGSFDIIETCADGNVVIKAAEQIKLKYFNGENDILIYGGKYYRIKGIQAGGLLLAPAELVDDTQPQTAQTSGQPYVNLLSGS